MPAVVTSEAFGVAPASAKSQPPYSVFHNAQLFSPPGCGPCNRASNNRHYDCPPRMSDGRLFTDYRARCDINYVSTPELTEHGAMDSYTYRQYLLNNADRLLSQMRQNAFDSVVCGPCMEPYMTGTMLPEQQLLVCDGRTCSLRPTGKHTDGVALAVGRWYGDAFSGMTEQQQEYAQSDAEIRAGKTNCCGASEEDYDTQERGVAAASVNRSAVPYGGTPLTGGDPTIYRS